MGEHQPGWSATSTSAFPKCMVSGMPKRRSAVAGVFPRPARHLRHLGHSQRPGQQRRHHQRADQHRRAAHVRRREGQPLAQGGHPARPVPRKPPAGANPANPASAGRKASRPRPFTTSSRMASDSIGALGAIQRVYFNIGSCAEQCWVNHLTDLRQLDPQRAQLRPDAVRHRPVPARLPQLPCHRGPPAERARFLPDRARGPREGSARGASRTSAGHPSGGRSIRSQSGERPGKNSSARVR